MKLYEDLMERFWEECEDVEEYVELFHEHKTNHKEYAMTFLKTAEEEYMHAERILSEINKLWESKKIKQEHLDEQFKKHYSHYCVEHPYLCTELAEKKLEIEIAKKSMVSNF